jgi:hypothetical protein
MVEEAASGHFEHRGMNDDRLRIAVSRDFWAPARVDAAWSSEAISDVCCPYRPRARTGARTLLALSPPDVELDSPAELGAESPLEHEQRDPVVARVPGAVAFAEDAAERVDRGFQSVTQLRSGETPKQIPSSTGPLRSALSCRPTAAASACFQTRLVAETEIRARACPR